jgi:K+-sensing histidine kinase KdpD
MGRPRIRLIFVQAALRRVSHDKMLLLSSALRASMEMRKSGAGRYVLALLAAAAALGLGVSLAPLLGEAGRYHTLWAAVAAVVFSAWYCGLSPSIVTALSSAAGTWFLFFTPHKFLALPGRADLFGLLAFLLVSGLIIALGEANRRGQFARLHQAHVLDAANDAIIELNPAEDTIKHWNQGSSTVGPERKPLVRT